MKIDLVGPKRRGLAMGLNECAGYVAGALLAGAAADAFGLSVSMQVVALVTFLSGLVVAARMSETRPLAIAARALA
jgi:MFS family permease